MGLNTAVIYGSVRRERQGIKAARFVVAKLEERGHAVTLVDPLEYELPLLDLRYSEFEKGQAPEAMERVSQILSGADGFVIVSAEYNNSEPAALKNLLDHFQRVSVQTKRHCYLFQRPVCWCPCVNHAEGYPCRTWHTDYSEFIPNI